MDYIQKGTRAFHKANWALFLAGFITFANLYVTQPLLPTFSEAFHVSPAVASLSLSVTTFALAVSLIIVSSLSEAWGRKSLMTISIFAASVLTLALAFSPNFETILVLRVVQGIVFAGLPAIAMAYLGEEMEPASLGVAMGLYISGNSVGGLSGRVIIGTLTDHYNWHTGMMVLGGISLLVSLLFVWMLPSSKHFSARPLQLKALTKTLLQHLRDPSMLCLYGMGFLLMGSFVTLYNYIGFKLMAPPYNLSATIVGWIFVIYLVGTFSSAWFGSLADRYGRQRMLLLAIAIMLAGAIVTLNGLLTLKIIGITVFTFGFFAAHSIASGWVSKRASHDKAQASSLYLFFYYFGSSVGGTVGGVFWMKYGWMGVIVMIALFLFIACILSFLLKRLIVRQRITT
ncbi:MFS transporter [Lysinibacillus sp. HST-98]|uniref:MFS transporter n=1 Tax=Lysinibacillus TaxID=400634 RepID=UPI0001DA5BF4|nr:MULTISPECIES: MFS transporter [Lysinibacillus]EFI66712.1 putative transport protein [Lysinibacillus fusiformis ZC1]EKU43945.1 putative transport protein [Lysinibacillus fusiformis ZB2]MBL3729201.1 MFS transporter [Lysinibacillus sp. HST-98]MBU5251893.1 MFS transporter [Lysinibacillus capsici]MED4697606.1 MFS transporter [Lysinibacillus capsici]